MTRQSVFVVLVTGGRDYADRETLWLVLDVLACQYAITHIMHGAARGADTLADEWAEARGVQPVACRALWRTFRRSAGHRRNALMAALSPNLCVAFPGGSGTAGMCEVARMLGIEVREVLPRAA